MERVVTPNLDPAGWGHLPGRLIVISGAAGSGKTTLVGRLLQREDLRLRVSISATTRDPRPGEVPGQSYYFLPVDRFLADRAVGAFLETAEVHGHWYGTPAAPVQDSLEEGTSVILVIDVQGARAVRELVPDALLIFIHAPSPEVLAQRLKDRGTDTPATIQKRLANAPGEVAQAVHYDYEIVNDDLDQAVDELVAILTENLNQNRNRPGGVTRDA